MCPSPPTSCMPVDPKESVLEASGLGDCSSMDEGETPEDADEWRKKEENKEREKKICTLVGGVPKGWAERFYQMLQPFQQSPIDEILELQKLLVRMEFCESCAIFQYPNCSLGDNCTDLVKFIRGIAGHYCGMRNFLRRIYKLRQINNWMMQLDNIFEWGSFQSFLKHIDMRDERRAELSYERAALPDRIRKKYGEAEDFYRELNENEIADVKNDDEKFGTLKRKFAKAIRRYPKLVCDICLLWVAKTREFKVFDDIPFQIARSVVI